MKISLRKANALQMLIAEKLGVRVVDTVTITKYDNVTDALVAAQKELEEAVVSKFELMDVLYAIREKVAVAGMNVGIAKLLTDLARNEKEAAFLKQLEAASPLKFTNEQIVSILADLVNQKDAYGRTKDAVTVGLLEPKVIDTYKSKITTLRKEKTAISDKLLHLNVSTEIELDEKEVTVLNKYDIL
jgi:hypothetical protein